jgi:hypothetical protein
MIAESARARITWKGDGDPEITMRAARLGLAWVAAATLLACSTSAWGAEPGPDTLPIHVIAVQTADADDQAEALTKALRTAVRTTPGWALGEGDYSLEVLTLSLKCPEPPDANCQTRIAEQIKSERYIWGVIQKKGPNIQGDVYLWARGQGTSKVSVSYSSNLTEANDDALRRIANNAITELTGGPPKGSLHVKAGNISGEVFVDGLGVGALQGGQGTFVIPSGNHRVTVKADGYADGESTVLVRPTGPAAEVTISLVPLPAGPPVNWKRIGGFSALGLGVAFGAIGLYGSIKIIDLNKTANQGENGGPKSPMFLYRQHVGTKVSSVCAYALDNPSTEEPIKTQRDATLGLCKDAEAPTILQIVFYPLAAIAGGVGAYLIGTSSSSDKATTTGFRIAPPEAGPGGAKFNVVYTW